MEVVFENVIKKFKKSFQLTIEDITVHPGEIVGLIGNNGAGKTTLLKCILDLLKLDYGRIMINGRSHAKDDSWVLTTGAYLDRSYLFDFLTPTEYLERLRKNYRVEKSDFQRAIDQYDLFLQSMNRSRYIRDLSDGNIQKIGIISSLLHMPELVILDEPFNFLDPTAQFQLVGILKDYCKNHHCTLIVSSHNLDHITKLATRLLLIEDGNIILDESNNDQAISRVNQYFIQPSAL